MKCPECGNEMERGFLEVKDTASLTQRDTMAIWYPEDEKGKFFNPVLLLNFVSKQLSNKK